MFLRSRFNGGDLDLLNGRPRGEWLPLRAALLGGGDLEMLTSRRPLTGGVIERESRLPWRRGDGLIERETDLVGLRPRATAFPFAFRDVTGDGERRRSRSRVREGERDLK